MGCGASARYLPASKAAAGATDGASASSAPAPEPKRNGQAKSQGVSRAGRAVAQAQKRAAAKEAARKRRAAADKAAAKRAAVSKDFAHKAKVAAGKAAIAKKKERHIKATKRMARNRSEASFKRAAKVRGARAQRNLKNARVKQFTTDKRMDEERRAKLKHEQIIRAKEKKWKAAMPERDHKERKQKQKPGCKKHRGKAQNICDRIADAGFKKCARFLDGLRFKKVKSKNTYMIHHLGLKLGLDKKAKKTVKKTAKKTAAKVAKTAKSAEEHSDLGESNDLLGAKKDMPDMPAELGESAALEVQDETAEEAKVAAAMKAESAKVAQQFAKDQSDRAEVIRKASVQAGQDIESKMAKEDQALMEDDKETDSRMQDIIGDQQSLETEQALFRGTLTPDQVNKVVDPDVADMEKEDLTTGDDFNPYTSQDEGRKK